MAQFQDPRVTAGPIPVALSEFVKKPAQRSHSGGSCGAKLTSFTGVLADTCISGMEKSCGLASQVQRLCFRAVLSKTPSPARQSNRALDKRPQLLSLGQSGNDAFFTRIDQ
jgi:hypothetical protein